MLHFFVLCKIVIGPKFQNFTLKCCFLAWRRASENFDCYPKMGEIFFYLTFLIKGCTWSKMCFIVCLKAKNEEQLKNIQIFTLSTSKTFKNFNFEFFFFESVHWCKGRYLQIFNNIKSLWFFKNKNFDAFVPRARGWYCWFFWNWTPKIMHDRHKSVCMFTKNENRVVEYDCPGSEFSLQSWAFFFN